jgi:chorismate-pyruvate lyase
MTGSNSTATLSELGSAGPLPVQPLVYPLDSFYARAGRPLPLIEAVAGEAMPEPYRDLLVHDVDMTSTLERYYNGRVRIEIIQSERRDDFYFRALVLIIEGTLKRIEFGAIRINLSLFKPAARQLILEGAQPLGRILQMCDVPYTSRPKAFLRMRSDAYINQALGLEGSLALYGRRNTLFDPKQRAYAEIVEILPP